MFGSFLAPIFFTAYYGLKETLKYSYYSPRVLKKYKGNSGWMEVRFRHPSPANIPQNEGHAAREHIHHHFKVPYPYSRYYVRNYWDPVKEGDNPVSIRVIPQLEDFNEQQLAYYLGYTKGDDLANQRKKESFLARSQEISAKNNPKEYSLETSRRYQGDLRVMFKGLNEWRKDRDQLDDWEDPAEFPGASNYIAGPDTFLQEYSLHHWSSYENHLFIELEKYADDMVQAMEEEGVPNNEGNAGNWQILDDSHRADQQINVVRNLKQRNIKKII